MSTPVCGERLFRDLFDIMSVAPFIDCADIIDPLVAFLNVLNKGDPLEPDAELFYLKTVIGSSLYSDAIKYVDRVLLQRNEDKQLLLLGYKVFVQWITNDPDRFEVYNDLAERVLYAEQGSVGDGVRFFMANLLLNEADEKEQEDENLGLVT